MEDILPDRRRAGRGYPLTVWVVACDRALKPSGWAPQHPATGSPSLARLAVAVGLGGASRANERCQCTFWDAEGSG